MSVKLGQIKKGKEPQRQISQEKGRRSAGKLAKRGRQSKRSNPSARARRETKRSK